MVRQLIKLEISILPAYSILLAVLTSTRYYNRNCWTAFYVQYYR